MVSAVSIACDDGMFDLGKVKSIETVSGSYIAEMNTSESPKIVSVHNDSVKRVLELAYRTDSNVCAKLSYVGAIGNTKHQLTEIKIRK